MLSAKILNEDASLNQFHYLDTVEFVPGASIRMVIRLWDTILKDRFVPDSAAIVKLTFNLTDGSTLEKTTTVVDSGDRSMQYADLSVAETEDLLGGNVLVTLDVLGDETEIKKAVIQTALSKKLLDGCEC